MRSCVIVQQDLAEMMLSLSADAGGRIYAVMSMTTNFTHDIRPVGLKVRPLSKLLGLLWRVLRVRKGVCLPALRDLQVSLTSSCTKRPTS